MCETGKIIARFYVSRPDPKPGFEEDWDEEEQEWQEWESIPDEEEPELVPA